MVSILAILMLASLICIQMLSWNMPSWGKQWRNSLIINWVIQGHCKFCYDVLFHNTIHYTNCKWHFSLIEKSIHVSFQVENVRMIDWLNPRRSTLGTLYLSSTHTIFVDNLEARKETWVGIETSHKILLAGDQASFSNEPNYHRNTSHPLRYTVSSKRHICCRFHLSSKSNLKHSGFC